jgi:predicted GH43/DUF377 family glycosyl hydrolase
MNKPVMLRQNLQSMKSSEDNRLKKIDEIVNSIYSNVIQTSKTKTEKFYKYFCNFELYEKTFIEDNKNDIFNRLRVLFPDCLIVFKFFLIDNNQQTHEFTDVNENLKQFVTRNYNMDYILIDWS